MFGVSHYKCDLILLCKSALLMASPYSSSGAFASPGRSTVKVYGDRVVSTVQAPPLSSSRGKSTEGPSETVYFPSPQTSQINLASRVSSLEEEIASLRSELFLIKGRLESQDAVRQASEEKYTQNI